MAPPAFGLGLRPPFYAPAMRGDVALDWFELISENFMVDGGKPLAVLDAVCEHYPVALHGVSLNLGGSDPLDEVYLDRLDALVSRCDPLRVSDHLCWTRHGGHHLHDLLPLPYTQDTVTHVADRIQRVQDRLKRQILIENVSSYAGYAHSDMREYEFLTAVAEHADCLILLDINNIVISAHNHGFDADTYLQIIPAERIRQIHLAGHSIVCPSTLPSVRYIGEQLPHYLANQKKPQLTDLARLEWAVLKTFDAADASALTVVALYAT